MGGPNSFFNNPLNKKKDPEPFQKSSARPQNVVNLENSILQAGESGEISKQTGKELSSLLYGDAFHTENQFDANTIFSNVMSKFEQAKGGKTSAERSRLATQKMFEVMQAKPGQMQTLLTPRSNKGMF